MVSLTAWVVYHLGIVLGLIGYPALVMSVLFLGLDLCECENNTGIEMFCGNWKVWEVFFAVFGSDKNWTSREGTADIFT